MESTRKSDATHKNVNYMDEFTDVFTSWDNQLIHTKVAGVSLLAPPTHMAYLQDSNYN